MFVWVIIIERTQHVAVNVDVAGKIGVSDPAFVDTADCPQTCAIIDLYAEAWRARSEAPDRLVWQHDIKRNR